MKKLIIFIILFLGLAGLIGLVSYSSFESKIISQNDKIIEIEKGESYHSLSEKFDLNPILFKIFLKLNPIKNSNLQAGKYKIEAGTKLNNLIAQLKDPINETDIQITILEGWNIYDIDYYLSNPIKNFENKPLITKGDFIKKIDNFDPELTGQFSFLYGPDSLEGFLYPDTYFINPNNFSIEGFINKMLNNFNKKVYKKVLKGKNLNEINSIINLASIVEKEEKNSKEKSTVAGILKKRLDKGWMIGADITVCYPHKLTSEQCKMVVSKYIEEKSEYNTRTMLGLPKTPIGNPSLETINAVLNPKETPYYYYLHDTVTGKIYYGITNADHEKNKRLYLR